MLFVVCFCVGYGCACVVSVVLYMDVVDVRCVLCVVCCLVVAV